MLDTYEERKKKIIQQIAERKSAEKEFLLIGITGKPKVGKSGLAMDCRTEEEIKNGMKVKILDLDDGSTATWDSAWDRDDNIEIFITVLLGLKWLKKILKMVISKQLF